MTHKSKDLGTAQASPRQRRTAGDKFIRSREKRASKLGGTPAARTQATRELEADERSRISRTPEGIAKKNIEIDIAEAKLLGQKEQDIRDKLQTNKPEEISKDIVDPQKKQGIVDKLKEGFFSKKFDAQGNPITELTFPGLSLGGGAGAFGKTGEIAKKLQKAETIANIQKRFKVTKGIAEKVASKVEQMDINQMSKLLTDKPKILKGAVKVTGALIGTSALTQWFAVDNIIGGVSIQTRDVANQVRFGEISSQEGAERLAEQEGLLNLAVDFTRINTALNPVLWPFRKLYVNKANNSRIELENRKLDIENLGIEQQVEDELIEGGIE